MHVSGDVDVTKMLTDIGSLAASIPGADAQGIDPSQLGAVSGAVTDASVDVYSGEDDHVLRKIDANLTIDPTQIVPEGAIPVSNIQIQFSVEIDGLNEDQTIEAPTDAKPISELLGDTGLDPSTLGGLGGASLGGGSSGGGAAGSSFEQCIQQASTPDEINACATQLGG